MKLPRGAAAFISQGKLYGDLLSDTHPVGRSKARFFRTVGFTRRNAALLEAELLRMAREEPVEERVETQYGTKFIVDGIVRSPTGPRVTLRSVWIVSAKGEAPRLVTAYPL